MADWPTTQGGNRLGAYGVVTSGNTAGTTITAPTSANTKTGAAWTPLIATTDTPGNGLMLTMYSTSTTIATRLIDVGIGPSGAEQIIIPNILYSNGISDQPAMLYLPLRIPVGVRLAARMQASTASNTIVMTAVVHSGVFTSPTPYSRVVDYGSATGSSRGQGYDPGGTANSKATTGWVQFGAGTTGESARGIFIAIGNRATVTRSAATSWLVDIGVTDSASAITTAQVLIPNFHVRGNVNEMLEPIFSPFFPCKIPQNSKLAVRAQCNSINTTDRLLDVNAYTVI